MCYIYITLRSLEYVRKMSATHQFIFQRWFGFFTAIRVPVMTSSNGKTYRVTGPLWGESIGHRCILLTKASDAELWCFLWCAPEQTVEQTIETPVIWKHHGAHYYVIVMWCRKRKTATMPRVSIISRLTPFHPSRTYAWYAKNMAFFRSISMYNYQIMGSCEKREG